ncbi:uncharacterized protein LOC131161573 [Malania oleifera]|uniref:uncharacterized protein LOC131161573 n=1 Tax=Malania oleifera TaxID=397392 RepID=UPI0025AE4C37|nr:uncharacterized protein LOC131161573 [Malania oleifera]XP_057973409.1 uncharacterized protein LOC131161573 [Malania oleifera]XP_057973418.1 uncharacterized protein LOC131161573 [Malania oleifera]
MVRPKQRQLLAVPVKKNNSPSGFIDSSSSKAEVDIPEEDGWVIVKKQKVNILIPPLLGAKQSNMPGSQPSQLQLMPGKSVNNPSQFLSETCPQIHSVDDCDNSVSVAHIKDIQVSRKDPPVQATSMLAKSLRPDLRVESENPCQVVTLKSHKMLGTSGRSKVIKHPRYLHGPIRFLDGNASLNQRMRASNLERKLQRAGGLSQWLASLGLGQFVRIFHGKSVDKFQLVNLTMKKLKDMGADAVGPRRKLMHAIDCLCQPYCFENF